MKQARIIYETNKPSINAILFRRGYQKNFDGMMDAFDDLGDPLLVEIFSDITSSYDSADGNFWQKFRNIFHKAVNIGGGVDSMINRDKQENNTNESDSISKEEEQKKSNRLLLYVGAGALLLIIILMLIYAFKK